MKLFRKIFAFLISAMLMASLVGCGASNEAGEESTTQTEEPKQQEVVQGTPQESDSSTENTAKSEDSEEKGKILVIYFSRTGEQYTVGVIDKGNTAIVAEMIADETGADMFEVLPADDHYPLTYAELTDVAKSEQNDNARPEYAGEMPDLSSYDTIFVGAPVWWGDWPMIMYTVFENNDFSGKTLVPFSTHEGSGLSGFDKKLSSSCPDSTVLDGLAIRGNDAQNKQDDVREEVTSWIRNLGY